MWSSSVIADISRQAAIKAKAYEKEPIRVETWGNDTIPFLGSYLPDGWKLVDQRFVDSTGLGRSYEPALTVAAFRKWVEDTQAADPHAGFGILEQGQMQVYVGYYTCDSCPAEPSEDLEFSPTNDIEFEWCGNCEEPKEVGEPCENCGWDGIEADTEACDSGYSEDQVVNVLAENVNVLVMDNPDIRPFDVVKVKIIEVDEPILWVVLDGDLFGSAVAMIQDSDVLPSDYDPASDPRQGRLAL